MDPKRARLTSNRYKLLYDTKYILLYLIPLAFVDVSINSVGQICSVLCWAGSVGYGMMPPGHLEFLEVALMHGIPEKVRFKDGA